MRKSVRKVLLTLLLVLAMAAPASGGEWVNVTVRDQNGVSVPSTVPPPVVSYLGSVEVFRPSIGDRFKNGLDVVKETLVPARPPAPGPYIAPPGGIRVALPGGGFFGMVYGRLASGWSALRGR